MTLPPFAASIAAMANTFESVELCGMPLASIDSRQLVEHLFASLSRGQGGWLITANLDFLRRHVKDPESRDIYAGADLRVADGMPLVWASRLRGTPLPERVAGSSLVTPICQRAAHDVRQCDGGRPVDDQPERRAVAVIHEEDDGAVEERSANALGGDEVAARGGTLGTRVGVWGNTRRA